MKLYNYVIIVLLLTVSGDLFAQDIPKPDFKNQPMLLVDGELKKLEIQTASAQSKMRALGYGGVDFTLTVSGKNSDVKTKTNPVFIVWVDEGIDPTELFTLAKTDNKGKRRDVILSTSSLGTIYGNQSGRAGKYQVSFSVEKVDNGVYKIMPDKNLEATTSYAFYKQSKDAFSMQRKVYLFDTE